jgi:HEAT repeat protein
MSTSLFRRQLNRWIAVVVVLLLVIGAISDLGGAWQSWQGFVQWAVKRAAPRGAEFFSRNESLVTVSTYVIVIIVIAILIAVLNRIVNPVPATEDGATGEKSSAGRRRKPAKTVRQKYLEYIEEDIRNRRKASIHFARFLDIGLSESLNATMPLNFVTHDYYIYPSAGVRQYTAFEEAFEHYKGRLLLLGHPGSGKTTTLLNLVLTLIEKAKRDASAPVPLLLNLSKFTNAQEKGLFSRLSVLPGKGKDEEKEARVFEQWLVQMLAEMPVEGIKNVARQWIENGQVALLLDGLDEVNDAHVKELVGLINRPYLHDHPQQIVVVCSRIIEYQPLLDNKETRLALNGAVTLKSLDREQINTYLETAQATALRDALFDHEDLYEMAESPLTLSMMTLAYGGKAPINIPQNQPFLERRRQLLDTYVTRMVQRNARRLANVPFDLNPDNDMPTRYSLKQINHYLGWLAIKLSERMKTLLPLGRLHSFLSNNPKDVKEGAFTSPNAATMIVGLLISLLAIAVILFRPASGATPPYLPALSLLAPVSFLAIMLFDDSNLSLSGSEMLGTAMMVLTIAGVVAYGLFSFGLLHSSLLNVLSMKIHPAVSTVIVAFLIFMTVIAVDNGSAKELKKLATRGVPCLLLGALIPPAFTRTPEFLPHGLAAGCVLFFFLYAREENGRTNFYLYAFHFTWISAGIVGVGWLVSWFVDEPSAVKLAIVAPVTIGLILSNKNNGGVAVSFALALVFGYLFGGPALGILIAVGALLLNLRFLRERSHRAAERLLLNPALEFVLFVRGDICPFYRPFLRHAADALLLKHAGTEYEFVHRLLRDHFAIRELIPALFGASGDEQLRIINQLSRQGDSGFDALSGLITYPDSRVRVAAVEGLGRIAIPKTLPVFKRILQEDVDAEVRAATLRSLQKFPASSVFDMIVTGFEDRVPKVRSAALSVIRDKRDNLHRLTEVRAILQTALKDESEEVFHEALATIAGDVSSYAEEVFLAQLERVRAALKATAPEVRIGAVQILGHTNVSGVLDDLCAALRDVDSDVRRTAASALSKMGNPEAIPALLAAADDPDARVRSVGVVAIGYIAARLSPSETKQGVMRALLKSLTDKDENVRSAAASVLNNFHEESVLAALGNALRDRATNVRLAALRSLSAFRDRRTSASLLVALEDETLRARAAWALAEMRDPSVNPTLLAWLKSGKADLRVAAIITLSVSGNTEIAPTLREFLSRPPSKYTANIRKFFGSQVIDLQPYAAVALGRLRLPDSIECLLNLSPHESEQSLLARSIALTYLPQADVQKELNERIRRATGKQLTQLSRIADVLSPFKPGQGGAVYNTQDGTAYDSEAQRSMSYLRNYFGRDSRFFASFAYEQYVGEHNFF